MALTRSFRETVATRAQHDREFRLALFEEALQALFDGQPDEAKTLLRNCINATIGFDRLAAEAGIPTKSLMRMVGPSGNPTLRNFVLLVHKIQSHTGVKAQARVFDPRDFAEAGQMSLASSTGSITLNRASAED